MLLTQTLYLDVYQNGFDVVLRQMIDVINGVNTYQGTATTYENIKAHVKHSDNRSRNINLCRNLYGTNIKICNCNGE